jgi:hypothetical protein
LRIVWPVPGNNLDADPRLAIRAITRLNALIILNTPSQFCDQFNRDVDCPLYVRVLFLLLVLIREKTKT